VEHPASSAQAPPLEDVRYLAILNVLPEQLLGHAEPLGGFGKGQQLGHDACSHFIAVSSFIAVSD